MKIEAKKIIAKEILLLFVTLGISILVFIGLNINNSYQKYYSDKIRSEIISQNLLLDSLDKPIKRFNKIRSDIFYHFGNIKGGYLTNGDIDFPSKKIVTINEEIELISVTKWNIYRVNYEKVFIKFDENDPLNILKNNNIDNTIALDKNEFYDTLIKSPILRNFVFVSLKNVYNSNNIKDLKSFENLILFNIELKQKIKEVELIKERIADSNQSIKICVKRSFDIKNIYEVSFNVFILLSVIIFLLRYLYLLLRWCYRILKLNN